MGEATRRVSIDLAVTLVIVSDFEPGTKTWTDERRALEAFLQDPAGMPGQILVMESEESVSEDDVPSDIVDLAPRVEVVIVPARGSAELKDAATALCLHDLVAVVEADCLPESGWLAALVNAMEQDPELDIVSSPTTYGDETSLRRVGTVLHRGYLEQRGPAPVSNNGALYRRVVLEKHRYPAAVNPFVSAQLRNRAMKTAGVQTGLVATTSMRHAFEGLAFIVDVHRNKGYQAARVRGGGPGSAVRRGLGSVRVRMRDDFRSIRDVGPRRLRPLDWPLMVLMFVAVRIPEFRGALAASDPVSFAATTDYR